MVKRIDPALLTPVVGTLYPSPFDAPCRARQRRKLGDTIAAGPSVSVGCLVAPVSITIRAAAVRIRRILPTERDVPNLHSGGGGIARIYEASPVSIQYYLNLAAVVFYLSPAAL